MRIDYLITTIKKSSEEIVELVKKTNIKGSFIVGNQLCEHNSIEKNESDGYSILIINQTSAGVSKNRNTILKKSTADFITFLDDDMYVQKDSQFIIENELIKHKNVDCIRFNVVSDDKERSIKQITNQKYLKKRDITGYGVCGCFYNRRKLIDNNLFFNEEIGPGTKINHGEDTLFNLNFMKLHKIYQTLSAVLYISKSESTWHGKTRDLNNELFSHGFLYYLLYKKSACFMSFLFLLTHMKCYPKGTRFWLLFKLMKKGIYSAKIKKI